MSMSLTRTSWQDFVVISFFFVNNGWYKGRLKTSLLF